MKLQFGALRLVCSCGSDDVLAVAPGTEPQPLFPAGPAGARVPYVTPEEPTRAWCAACWVAQFACEQVPA